MSLTLTINFRWVIKSDIDTLCCHVSTRDYGTRSKGETTQFIFHTLQSVLKMFILHIRPLQ